MDSEKTIPLSDQPEITPINSPRRKIKIQFIFLGLIFTIFLLTSIFVIFRGRSSVKPENKSNLSSITPTFTPSLPISPKPSPTSKPPKILSRLNGYQIEEFDLIQSPFCNLVYKECNNMCNGQRDLRLINNQSVVVIPSLLQLTYSLEPNCVSWASIDLFSVPISGNFIYLSTSTGSPTDAPYSGIDEIFRFNYLSKEIHKLSSTDYIRKIDLYRGSASDSYKLLTDGKTILKWNKNEISLVNLESDKVTKIYTPPDKEWLISEITFGMGQTAKYDIQISGSEIVVGLYSRTETENNKSISIDANNNVNVQGEAWGVDIKPKFINRIHLPLP